MRKIIAISLGALALGAGLVVVRATEPAAPVRGRVLILDNERTLTGEVEQVGEQFRVKRVVGETWIPAEKVLKLCASLEDAHRYMQSRANLDDPDERVRLAEWCRQHGLRDAAVAEAKAALALKPDDHKIRRLHEYLEHAKSVAEQPRAVAVDRPTPRVDVTAETLGMFASKVQPILMNACVSCHTGGRGGSFQLARTSGGMSNRRSLEQNLAAAVAEINPREPGTSRLLHKAISNHAPGMTQSPLKNREAAAYRTLDEWVRLTLANNPNLREQAVASAPPPPAPAAPAAPPASGQWGDDRGAKKAEPAKQPETKEQPKASNDPADPDTFNREFHPDRKQ